VQHKSIQAQVRLITAELLSHCHWMTHANSSVAAFACLLVSWPPFFSGHGAVLSITESWKAHLKPSAYVCEGKIDIDIYLVQVVL
jgi:hypothetical protein